MTSLRLTADTQGNVVAHLTVSTAADVAHVEPLADGLVVLELGADEPVQVRITGPGDVLVDVLSSALADVLRHLDGVPG